MHFSREHIVVILMAGIIAGLLPSTVVQRSGARLAGDLAIGIVVVFIGNFLILVWRGLLPAKNGLQPVETINYEPVVLPLPPLRTLLKPIIPRSREEICGSLVDAARRNDLPTPFFIRLLYQESGFRPEAISMSGAMGIAQFMPETAADRKLIIRSIHCKRYRPPRACCAICKRSSAISVLRRPPTTRVQNASKIGSSTKGRCRSKRRTT